MMAWNNMFASLISRSAFWVNFKGSYQAFSTITHRCSHLITETAYKGTCMKQTCF